MYKKLYENYKNGKLDVLIINYPKTHVLKDERILYNLDYFKIKENVQINNDTFILDSMIFTNYNIRECQAGHSIAGITCNNKRYIYNGWTSQTTDLSMLSADNSMYSNIPCALIPYDWFNPSEDLSFCLNSEKCKLDFFSLIKGKKKHKEDLCFNFSLGDNMHVFINKKSYNPTFIVSAELNSPISPDSPDSPDSQLSINNNSKFIVSSELNTPTSPDDNSSLQKALDIIPIESSNNVLNTPEVSDMLKELLDA